MRLPLIATLIVYAFLSVVCAGGWRQPDENLSESRLGQRDREQRAREAGKNVMMVMSGRSRKWIEHPKGLTGDEWLENQRQKSNEKQQRNRKKWKLAADQAKTSKPQRPEESISSGRKQNRDLEQRAREAGKGVMQVKYRGRLKDHKSGMTGEEWQDRLKRKSKERYERSKQRRAAGREARWTFWAAAAAYQRPERQDSSKATTSDSPSQQSDQHYADSSS